MSGIERATQAWRALDPRAAEELIDARLQTHHAAQLATAVGISYLPHRADDSHTNLEWIAGVDALASHAVAGATHSIRVAVRPAHLALLILGTDNAPLATLNLNGRTIAGAERWIRGQLADLGIDAERYTLARHYAIPGHAVATGTAFNVTNPARFAELANWFADAALVLEKIATSMPHASPVRCWPHHFDIATLIDLTPGQTESPRSIGVGLEPGDQYYREPYFYVTPYPAPAATALPALGGDGTWHTHEWTGAVLPASRLVSPGSSQHSQVDEFTSSAIRACMRM